MKAHNNSTNTKKCSHKKRRRRVQTTEANYHHRIRVCIGFSRATTPANNTATNIISLPIPLSLSLLFICSIFFGIPQRKQIRSRKQLALTLTDTQTQRQRAVGADEKEKARNREIYTNHDKNKFFSFVFIGGNKNFDGVEAKWEKLKNANVFVCAVLCVWLNLEY